MKNIVRQHQYLIISYFVFLIAGIITRIQIDKGDIIFFFSEIRTPFLDYFFGFATKLGEVMAYVLLIILFLFIRYSYSILVVLSAAFAGVASAIFKNIFRHPRPKPYFESLGIDISDIAVNGHDLYTSQISSFPSGHTISAFTLFSVLALLSKNVVLQISLLVVAIIVGLSRIYLVHHFLEDVLLGSFIGICIGFTLVLAHNNLPNNVSVWYNRSLIKKV